MELSDQMNCEAYKRVKMLETSFQTTSMPFNARLTIGVFVPSFGLALFGGVDNPSTKVLLLPELDSAWTTVADLYRRDDGQCHLQVHVYLRNIHL